jgi:hypothetical protein
MRIGDLVKWEVGRNSSWLAIVLDDQEEEDEYGTVVMLVQWVTGNFIGEETFLCVEDLELIG